ncbi:MAG: hypothetical protein GYA59_06395 [Chloroflexi bacterium]|jgi:lysozyme|nr:hypothetical protein [Chloroflexota bacterium]
MERAFGIDVSRYQGLTDWDVVAAHVSRVVFAGIRATISWGYRDPWFSHNWQEAKRVGVLRMAYHVVYPSQDADRQVDNFLGMLGSDLGELPPVLDVELDQGQTPTVIANNILRHAQLIEARTGKRPIIYSRASWVDPYMAGATWLNNYDWWLAHYLSTPDEHPGPPKLPKTVTKWLIHQTTSHGAPIGVESKQMDYDRWNGDEAAVYRYANLPVPIPQPTWEEAIDAWARTLGYNGPPPPKPSE